MTSSDLHVPPKPISAALTRDELSQVTSLMAADRTLLAWTRTSLSLISFGFTIYKFLQYAAESGLSHNIDPVRGPRHLGMAMIALGVLFLIAASVQYWATVRRIGVVHGAYSFRLALYFAVFLALLGVAALLNITFRMDF